MLGLSDGSTASVDLLLLDSEGNVDRISGLRIGLVEAGLNELGAEFEIEILGELYKATVIEESFRDPPNQKLRA
jgi:hypothetical protein